MANVEIKWELKWPVKVAHVCYLEWLMKGAERKTEFSAWMFQSFLLSDCCHRLFNGLGTDRIRGRSSIQKSHFCWVLIGACMVYSPVITRWLHRYTASRWIYSFILQLLCCKLLCCFSSAHLFAPDELENSFKLLFQSFSLWIIFAEVKKDVKHWGSRFKALFSYSQ